MSQIFNEVPNSASDSTLVFSEFLRLYEASQLVYCGVDRTNQTSDGKTLLFNSSSVAKEAADVLRGDWDGSNAVTVRQYDVVAVREDNSLVIEYAGESVKLDSREEIEFCEQGQYCYVNKLSRRSQTKAGSGRSIILTEKMMQTLEAEWERSHF